MSEPYEARNKMSIDTAYEKAWEWWDNLSHSKIEETILILWMKENNITYDQIDV